MLLHTPPLCTYAEADSVLSLTDVLALADIARMHRDIIAEQRRAVRE